VGQTGRTRTGDVNTGSAETAEPLAARFAREGIARCRRGAAVYCAIAGAVLIASAAYSGVAEPSIFRDLLQIRVFELAAIVAVACLLATPFGARRPRELMVALMCAVSFAMHLLAQQTGNQLSPQYDRLMLAVLGAAVLMSWNGMWSALGCAAVVGTYVIGSAVTGELSTPQFPANVARLLAVSLVAITVNVARERARWRHLWHVDALATAREQAEAAIRRMNEELERRVLERTAALRASEERFRVMFAAAPIGIVAVTADGAVMDPNPAFAAMLGVAPGALTGRPLVQWIGAEARGGVGAALADLRAGARSAVQLDTDAVRADGGALRIHCAFAAVRDEAGGFLYALGLIEDVTERIRAEERAREHQDQLAHVLRVASLGGMVAELAHELNQPLCAIANFANGVQARLGRGAADGALGEAVASITAQAMRAAEIVRRVREFVRPGGVPTDAVDLNALIREAVHLIAPDAERHRIPIRLQLATTLPPMMLDRIHIEQVLLNLFRNAIDAMPAAPHAGHELVVQSVTRADGAVEVRVCDTGVGVPDTAVPRIFDAFYTTKAGGLGMGLSISRSIIEAYGGRVWASRNADRGMTFAFALPTGDVGAASRAAS
jgi:PAS domain S-box-containing protein